MSRLLINTFITLVVTSTLSANANENAPAYEEISSKYTNPDKRNTPSKLPNQLRKKIPQEILLEIERLKLPEETKSKINGFKYKIERPNTTTTTNQITELIVERDCKLLPSGLYQCLNTQSHNEASLSNPTNKIAKINQSITINIPFTLKPIVDFKYEPNNDGDNYSPRLITENIRLSNPNALGPNFVQMIGREYIYMKKLPIQNTQL